MPGSPIAHPGAGRTLQWLLAVHDIAVGVEDTRWQDLAMGCSAMLMSYWLERVKTKYTPIRTRVGEGVGSVGCTGLAGWG